MSNLADVSELAPIQVWDGVVARRVQGERLTVAVVELAPNAIVPEHRHANEQCGLVIEGEVTFRVGDTPHAVVTGPAGAVVIDVFSPARDDWDDRPTVGAPDEPAGLVWPRGR